jgi:hypothetical protein
MPRDVNRIWKRMFWRPQRGDIVKFSHLKSYYKVENLTELGVVLMRLRRLPFGWEGVEWKFVFYDSPEYDKMEVCEECLS